MVFDSELGRVASQRKRTVGQIAKFWGQQQLLEDTPRIEADKPGLTGHQLIVRLQASSKVRSHSKSPLIALRMATDPFQQCTPTPCLWRVNVPDSGKQHCQSAIGSPCWQ